MGRAIAVRTDYRSGDVRRIAQRVKNAAQARRLLAIAAVLDGAARQEAAKIGGMDRQTLRDWVIRFNEQGPDGLINKASPGAPGKLTNEHKAFLARLVEDGPIPAIDGVVRWRACDLIMRLHQEFGISVSDDTVYRSLKGLGYSHVSARPRAYQQNAEAMEAFKKTSPSVWRKSGRHSHPAQRVGQKNGPSGPPICALVLHTAGPDYFLVKRAATRLSCLAVCAGAPRARRRSRIRTERRPPLAPFECAYAPHPIRAVLPRPQHASLSEVRAQRYLRAPSGTSQEVRGQHGFVES